MAIMFGDRIIFAEAPRPAAIRRHPRAPWLAVGGVRFGAFSGQLDASIITLLRAGVGIAALSAEAVSRPACRTGSGLPRRVRSAVGLVMLIFMPASPIGIVACLALCGLGLGIFVPANNAVIPRSGPAGSAAVLGGLVNMARGIGTSLGIALVMLLLHLAGTGAAGRPDPVLALAGLAAAAAAAAAVATAIRPRAAAGGREPAAASRPDMDQSRAFS